MPELNEHGAPICPSCKRTMGLYVDSTGAATCICGWSDDGTWPDPKEPTS